MRRLPHSPTLCGGTTKDDLSHGKVAGPCKILARWPDGRCDLHTAWMPNGVVKDRNERAALRRVAWYGRDGAKLPTKA